MRRLGNGSSAQALHLESISVFKDSSECHSLDLAMVLKPFSQCAFYPIRQLIVTYLAAIPLDLQSSFRSSLTQSPKTESQRKRQESVLLLKSHQYREQRRKLRGLLNVLEHIQKEARVSEEQHADCNRQYQTLIVLDKESQMDQLEKQFPGLQDIDISYKRCLNRLLEVRHFGEYLVSAVNVIIKYQKFPNNYPQPQKFLAQYTNDVKKVLEYISHTPEDMDQKRLKLSLQLVDFDQTCIIDTPKVKYVHSILYKLVPCILNQTKTSGETYLLVKANYAVFLGLFKQHMDLREAKENIQASLRLIQAEKQLLTNRLKENHQLLLAYYDRTQGYAALIADLQVKPLVAKLLGPHVKELQHCIEFMNKDYGKFGAYAGPLFAQLCQSGQSGEGPRKLQEEISAFKNADSNDQYNTIILHFLSRMSQLSR